MDADKLTEFPHSGAPAF